MSTTASRSLSAIAAEWINRQATGLAPAEEAELANWLAADPTHREAFERSGRVWSLLDRPHEIGVAETVAGQLAARRVKRVRRRAVITGASVVSALVMAVLVLAPGLPSLPPSTAVLTQVRSQILADGSRVELKADAQVEPSFVPAERRVQLVQGEAHFAVAKDAGRPFIVSARGVEVKAVGTAFAVRMESQSVEVLVTEGRVTVDQPATATHPTAPQLVTAGNRVVVATAAEPAPVQVTAVTLAEQEQRLAWRYPRLELSGTRLVDAVSLFNKHTSGARSVRLVVADPTLGDLEVSGFFRTDNVEGFIRLLEDSFGVKADRSEKEVVLRRAR